MLYGFLGLREPKVSGAGKSPDLFQKVMYLSAPLTEKLARLVGLLSLDKSEANSRVCVRNTCGTHVGVWLCWEGGGWCRKPELLSKF